MTDSEHALRRPDLALRPFGLSVEHLFPLSADQLYAAWTEGFDSWFAAPGSVWMRAEIGAPFFFEVEARPDPEGPIQRFPHYGRFLALVPSQFAELTWVTGVGGTEGAETVLSVELTLEGEGCRLKLTHAGFSSADARDRTENAWPLVLAQMEHKLQSH